MSTPNLSESMEMYLKAAVELSAFETPTVGRLAGRLGITQVSANEMVRRLTDQGLMTHTPYKGVGLTGRGQRIGGNVLRRQRLWEVFLHENLRIEWARLYELTCELEHATTYEVTEALAVYLRFPKRCPHGNPIPDLAGKIEVLNGVPLSELEVGRTAEIVAVRESRTDVLEHLSKHALLPGQKLTLLETSPMDGPLVLQIGMQNIPLGLLMAELILVRSIG